MLDPRLPSAARTASQSTLKVYDRKLMFRSSKLCHPDCFSASGTRSFGLRAYAHGVMVFAMPSRLFHRAPGLTIFTRTWYHGTISSCTRTLQLSARTCKNHATATSRLGGSDVNSPNRRAFIVHGCKDLTFSDI